MSRIFLMIVMALMPSFTLANTANTDPLHPKEMEWKFNGMFGTFDRAAAQRGFKVYKEVCSACHSLKRIAFRNLMEIGFSEEQVRSLASTYSVQDGPNDQGEMFERPGRLSDHIPSPYPNDLAARAANNNSALPPDLSLIVKARHDGANYVHSLLTGYVDAPKDFQLGENMYYNPYYAAGGRQFSMTPPLIKDGQVQYDDGTVPTVDQMAKDVVNFLQWAAEPEMEQRKRLGVQAILFMMIFTFFFYFAKKAIWKRVK